MKASSSICETLFTGWYSPKKKFWHKAIVLLVIESFVFGQMQWSWAQQSNQQNEAPMQQEIQLPEGMEYFFNQEQPSQAPFMPTLNPLFDVGPENPFFDSDNDAVPGSGSENTGYGLEDIISVDNTLRMQLSDISQLPRYKVTFSIDSATTIINIGFDELTFVTKPGGGYKYSEKVLSVKTKDGNIRLSYDYYTVEDGVEEEGSIDNDAIVNYQFGVNYIVEFQVTLLNIKVYIYEASQECPDEPSFTVEGFESPVFYAVNRNNQPNSLNLEVFKRVASGYEPVDLNNDGIIDAYYDSVTGIWGIDIDGDGIPDGQGIDTNGDGKPDQFRFDQDRDGIVDGTSQDFDIDFETGNFNVNIPNQDRTVITPGGDLVIYDIDGNEIARYSGGTSTSVEYLPGGGRRVTSTDIDGNVTTQVFDANDRLVQQTVQRKIDGVLEVPGERTGFLYDNDSDPANPGGEIRTQFKDNNGNGIKDPEDENITVAVFDSNQRMVSITYFDSPRNGDLTIQRFQANGNLASITVDQSVEHGDGWTIQIFDVNGYLQNITDHNGLTGDEVIQRYAPNGRILTQTDNDGATGEITVHYFSYKTDPDHMGWQIRTERINNEFGGEINSIARLTDNNALINVTIFSVYPEIATLIEYGVPEDGYTTYHSYKEDGDGEIKQVYNNINQITLQQDIDGSNQIIESIVYQYVQDGDNKLRIGYVDTDKNGVRDSGEDLLNSIAEFDNYGDLVSQTSFAPDGVTPRTVIEFNKPQYSWVTYRIVDEPQGKSTIQIVDYENNMRALMTLNSQWADYSNPDNVEESTVYVYDGDYRWGYVDTNKNGLKDVTETLLESVAEFDNEGNIV
ncbi:MAG: hypothetical protein RBU23_06850, partial [Candidatus Auribacterota bacterium]|nr:hypothetical protein [Candidatus Auribacterota bacterium]